MSHWQNYPSQWGHVAPPLRPAREVVSAVCEIAGSTPGPVLLLGVSPEFAAAFERIVAVDKNPAMIADVWPGDTAHKRAIAADWLEMDFAPGTFSAVVGDGSLNNVAYPDDVARLLRIALDVLEPGGRFVCRLFERPGTPFTIPGIIAAARAPGSVNFHALKWMIAMHLAAESGAMVAVARIRETFDALFPDRDNLSRATGWPRPAIDTIDVYEASPVSYCFPSRHEFMAAIPAGAADVRFTACGNYDLAACCPLLSFRKP